MGILFKTAAASTVSSFSTCDFASVIVGVVVGGGRRRRRGRGGVVFVGVGVIVVDLKCCFASTTCATCPCVGSRRLAFFVLFFYAAMCRRNPFPISKDRAARELALRISLSASNICVCCLFFDRMARGLAP